MTGVDEQLPEDVPDGTFGGARRARPEPTSAEAAAAHRAVLAAAMDDYVVGHPMRQAPPATRRVRAAR